MNKQVYIFKSKAAKKLLYEWGVPKWLVGKTLEYCDNGYKTSIGVIDPFNGEKWNIPLEACNVIDFEPLP